MTREFKVLTTAVVFTVKSSHCLYASISQIKSLKNVNPTKWSWKKVSMVKLIREILNNSPLLEIHNAYLHIKISQKSCPKEIN